MTLDAPRQLGAHVALLGIDGIGKTTLADTLRIDLEAVGRTVVEVSWLGAFTGANAGTPDARRYERLWMLSMRSIMNIESEGGMVLDPPDRWDEAKGWLGDVLGAGARLVGSPSGALATAWYELAAAAMLEQDIVRPAVERGDVVITDTFPFKHVVKDVLLAEQLDQSTKVLARACLAAAREYFATAARPDIGLLIDGNPRTAFARRVQQRGAPGLFESFDLTDRPSEQSFLDFQGSCAAEFRSFAASHGWSTIVVGEEGPAAVADRARRLLGATELFAGWTGGFDDASAVGTGGSRAWSRGRSDMDDANHRRGVTP